MGALNNQRRYYLRKAQFAAQFENESDSLMRVYLAKHDELAGTPIPASMPHRVKLAAARYTALEDLQGADLQELTSPHGAGLKRFEAAAVLAVLGA